MHRPLQQRKDEAELVPLGIRHDAPVELAVDERVHPGPSSRTDPLGRRSDGFGQRPETALRRLARRQSNPPTSTTATTQRRSSATMSDTFGTRKFDSSGARMVRVLRNVPRKESRA